MRAGMPDDIDIEAGLEILDDPTSFGRTTDARLTVESLLRGDDRFTWSVSHGTYMRAFNSPVANSYMATCPDDEAVDDASLVPVRQHAVVTGVGLDGVRRSKSKGDFVLKALARAIRY